MNYSEFKSHMVQLMNDHIGDSAKIQIKEIQKNNGIVYDGLIVNEGLNISPTFYLNPYYHRYLDGVKLEEIDQDILAAYQKSKPNEAFDVSFFMDYENVKDHILFKLINKEQNIALLEDIPYIDYLDLAIVFYYGLNCQSENFSSILIHNSHLKLWGKEKEDLFHMASLNSPLLLPVQITPLEEIVKHFSFHKQFPWFPSEELEYPPLFICSNASNIYGASVLLYENFLQQCAERFHSNFVILPSSIHEIILFPTVEKYNSYEMKQLSLMVQEINETEIIDEEILSNHVYFYDSDKDEILY